MTLEAMNKSKSTVKLQPNQKDIKSLLIGSSPKNPTYVLAEVLADFSSQGFSELNVRI